MRAEPNLKHRGAEHIRCGGPRHEGAGQVAPARRPESGAQDLEDEAGEVSPATSIRAGESGLYLQGHGKPASRSVFSLVEEHHESQLSSPVWKTERKLGQRDE